MDPNRKGLIWPAKQYPSFPYNDTKIIMMISKSKGGMVPINTSWKDVTLPLNMFTQQNLRSN